MFLLTGGFLYVDEVLKYKALSNYTVDDVRYVVDTNAKKRFSLEEEEGTKRLMIRANQGHSVTVPNLLTLYRNGFSSGFNSEYTAKLCLHGVHVTLI